MVHSWNRILFNDKKGWGIKPQKRHEGPKMKIAKWKKPAWKHYIHMIPSNDILKKKSIETVKISVVAKTLAREGRRYASVEYQEF